MTTETKAEIAVGTIMVSSWGYEQTNVDFYRVVKRTASMVTLQQLHNEITDPGKVCPSTEDKLVAPIRRKLVNGDSVRIESFAFANVWNGKPQSYSSYA